MEIKPDEAAQLAAGVYLPTAEGGRIDLFLNNPALGEGNKKSSIGFGETGSKLFNVLSKFAVLVRGVGTRDQDLFLIFRGTSKAMDFLTDIRAGLAISDNGEYVHSGFNDTFCSLKDDLANFLHAHPDTTTIHCIGHSLGGAVANLAANWISTRYHQEVYLYTFGSPRVGFGIPSLATKLPLALGQGNIRRVYHGNDVVTMVPVFPFVHAPLRDRSFYMTYADGGAISPSAHRMGNYVKSINGRDWNTLYKPHPLSISRQSISDWMDSDREENLSSASTWQKLEMAFAYLTQIKGVLLGVVVTGAVTMADLLAIMLLKGLELAGEAASWCKRLVRKIMRTLGMAVAKVIEDVSRAALRQILNRLLERLAREVKKSLDGLL